MDRVAVGGGGHLEYRKECGYEYEYDLRIEWGIGNVGSCAVAFPSTHFRRPNVAGPGGGLGKCRLRHL